MNKPHVPKQSLEDDIAQRMETLRKENKIILVLAILALLAALGAVLLVHRANGPLEDVHALSSPSGEAREAPLR